MNKVKISKKALLLYLTFPGALRQYFLSVIEWCYTMPYYAISCDVIRYSSISPDLFSPLKSIFFFLTFFVVYCFCFFSPPFSVLLFSFLLLSSLLFSILLFSFLLFSILLFSSFSAFLSIFLSYFFPFSLFNFFLTCLSPNSLTTLTHPPTLFCIFLYLSTIQRIYPLFHSSF